MQKVLDFPSKRLLMLVQMQKRRKDAALSKFNKATFYFLVLLLQE